MNSNYYLALKAGFITTFIYLFTSYVLDFFIDPVISNGISLIISIFINLILQAEIFLKGKLYTSHIIKFFIAEIIILIIDQFLVNYFIENKDYYNQFLSQNFKKYYITIIRFLTTVFIGFLISFNLRQYFVFK